MELHPILCCSEPWCSSHPIFYWPLKFIPFCVLVSCEILPILCCSGLWGVSQSLAIDLWSSFHLRLQRSVMNFHPLFQWALKFFSHPLFHWSVKFFWSCDMSCEVLSSAGPVSCEILSSAVPVSCEVFLTQFSSELKSQDSVVSIWTCKVRSSQSVFLSVYDGGNTLCALIMEAGKDWMKCYEWYEVLSQYMRGGTEKVPNYMNCVVHCIWS